MIRPYILMLPSSSLPLLVSAQSTDDVIPQAAHTTADSQADSPAAVNLKCEANRKQGVMASASNVKPAVMNADGSAGCLHADVPLNKPGWNWTLVKRMMHWLVFVAMREYWCKLKSNTAPLMATASVMSDKVFGVAPRKLWLCMPMQVCSPMRFSPVAHFTLCSPRVHPCVSLFSLAPVVALWMELRPCA